MKIRLMRLRITIAMLEIRNREAFQSKVNICKSDVKIGDYADSLADSQRLVSLSAHGGAPCLELHRSFELEIYEAHAAFFDMSTSIMRVPLFIMSGRLIELLLEKITE